MPVYATREDVIRELGGTRETLEARLGRRLWLGAVTSVTVDDNTFDVPDTVLARFEVQLSYANSKVNSYVLRAYEAIPTQVPEHLRSSTAQLAAYRSVTTDGVRPEYLRTMKENVDEYMRDLAKGNVDLGIEAPRPNMRKPAAFFACGS